MIIFFYFIEYLSVSSWYNFFPQILSFYLQYSFFYSIGFAHNLNVCCFMHWFGELFEFPYVHVDSDSKTKNYKITFYSFRIQVWMFPIEKKTKNQIPE